MIRNFTIFFFLFLFTLSAQAQTMESMPGPIVVCPHGTFSGHHYTPVAENILQRINNRDNDDPCANITVVYNGFTTQAQNAFQTAVDIWSFSLSSDVEIRVSATWEVLDEGVLGAAGPTEIFKDFTNAPNNDFYASALADQIAGTDLSPGEIDIVASFNSNFDWYYGVDGNPPNDAYDLVSVVLHELGHGLGFVSSRSYDEDTNEGTFGLGEDDIPLNYDRFLELANGVSLLSITEGTSLGNAFTSSNVFCNAPEAQTANGGSNPKIYAPFEYGIGSSLSHWDENSFPGGNVHSLMTPQIGPGEAIHNPGPITLGLFNDMGWTLCDNAGTGEDCLTWQDPSTTTGWPDFNIQFGGAPCDDGSGCPFNEIDVFEVFASEAYTVDGFLAGGEYTFSMCNGPGAGSWIPDFTIIAPSGAVDASGNGAGCSISWTASESGTYLIVINEAGNCGVANTIENGYPALTCVNGTADCVPNECATGDLIVEGETALCPGLTTTVNLDVPASIPTGGGFGIQFYNPITEDGINLSGITLPYTFDNDLNGLLSENGYDLFDGAYELVGFVYTDPDDATNTICVVSENAVVVTFLAADDPACDSEEPCVTGSLVIIGDSELCPDETTTVDLLNTAVIPEGGGYAIDFYNTTIDDGITLTAATLPYTFDNDLNGLLSANGYDLFEGEYEITGIVYSDADDIEGSICAVSENAVIVNFLAADDPACSSEDTCETGSLVITGDSEICPEITATVDLINAAIIPEGGGFGIQFYNPIIEEGINLSGVTLPFTFDNDLNGLLSANGFDLFEGEYELVGYVYTDPDDANNTICVVSEDAVIVTFLAADDPACSSEETCETGSLTIIGDSEICPEVTTSVDLINDAVIPEGGGFGIQFYNPITEDGINLSGVALPYTFDNDLNGLLSANGFDLFEGEYELVGYVYTDSDDANNTICVVSEDAVIVTFLAADDPACSSEDTCETGSLVINGDSEICPEVTTTVDLINAAVIPEGGGFGIQFYNPITEEGINLSGVALPYTFDNDLNGLLSANGFDLFEGEYELVGYVYTDSDDANNTICAESENVVLVTFLAANDPACDIEETCETGSLVINGDSEICPEVTTTVDLINTAVIPEGGGYGIQFYNPATVDLISLPDVTLPFTFDNDLNGFLSSNGNELLEGEYDVVGYVYSDANDINNTICATSETEVNVTFLGLDDPSCIDGINENDLSDGFSIYPNPASEYVSIQNDGVDMQNMTLKLTDIRGRTLIEKTGFDLTQNKIIKVQTTDLMQGVYIIVITSDQGMVTKRLVINR